MPPTTLVGPSWRTAEFDVPAYLESIGLASAGGPGPSLEPTSEVLSEVHSAHVRTLPFANVDVLLGQHPGIAPVTVHDQLVRRRRGGYCFEHTQLFAAALEYVGFTFRRALGRVRDVAGSRTHMTVVVRLDGREVLCDPGFGFSITSPIELRAGATQEVAGREFRIERWNVAGVGTWALTREGALEHVHDDLPVQPVDVTMGHLMTSTGADSPFRNHFMVMRHTDAGHVTVTETARTQRAAGSATRHDDLTVAEVIDGVRELGVELGREDREALTRTLERIRPQAHGT